MWPVSSYISGILCTQIYSQILLSPLDGENEWLFPPSQFVLLIFLANANETCVNVWEHNLIIFPL